MRSPRQTDTRMVPLRPDLPRRNYRCLAKLAFGQPPFRIRVNSDPFTSHLTPLPPPPKSTRHNIIVLKTLVVLFDRLRHRHRRRLRNCLLPFCRRLRPRCRHRRNCLLLCCIAFVYVLAATAAAAYRLRLLRFRYHHCCLLPFAVLFFVLAAVTAATVCCPLSYCLRLRLACPMFTAAAATTAALTWFLVRNVLYFLRSVSLGWSDLGEYCCSLGPPRSVLCFGPFSLGRQGCAHVHFVGFRVPPYFLLIFTQPTNYVVSPSFFFVLLLHLLVVYVFCVLYSILSFQKVKLQRHFITPTSFTPHLLLSYLLHTLMINPRVCCQPTELILSFFLFHTFFNFTSIPLLILLPL